MKSIAASLWVVVFGVLPARLVRASDGVEQCLQAYEAGQRLRQSGDLVRSAEELLVCGGPACPVRIQADCQRWLDDVERSMPAVVFRVRDVEGHPLADVSVSIDGGAPRRLDGRALGMNPGEHEVVFECAGYQPLVTPVFVTEGEKLEPRPVTLQSIAGAVLRRGAPAVSAGPAVEHAEAVPLAPPAHASLAVPLAAGAVGALGATGLIYFGVRAKNGEADLQQCTPNCSQSRVDGVKRDYLLSNVSLGVGIAGLAGAAILLLLDEPVPAGASAAPRHSIELGTVTRWVTRF
jgi:hypothetical protein